MISLITRLEKATAPDRKLDHDVHRMICGYHPAVRLSEYPRYTESIDAALTLVPEDWAWFIEWIGKPFSEGNVRLWIPSKRTKNLKTENIQVVQAATPVLVLCIAAMKARAACP